MTMNQYYHNTAVPCSSGPLVTKSNNNKNLAVCKETLKGTR